MTAATAILPPGRVAPPPPRDLRHLAYLGALRGWAILGVFVTHAFYPAGDFPGSFLVPAAQYGVQLFYLVSALTIFLS